MKFPCNDILKHSPHPVCPFLPPVDHSSSIYIDIMSSFISRSSAKRSNKPTSIIASAELDEDMPGAQEAIAEGVEPNPHQFWLKDLQAGEAFQAFHQNVQQLLLFTETFPGYHEQSNSYRSVPITTDGDLVAMARLTNDISHGLDRILTSRTQENTAKSCKRRRHQQRCQESMAMRRSCHECHRHNTPKWRRGPDGDGTLCNVCGLLFAKRNSRIQTNN